MLGTAASSVGPSVAQMGFGQVRHHRLRPARNAFAYPTCFLMLPLRSMARDAQAAGALPRNRSAALSFWDRDHGDGSDNCLAWLDATLRTHGINDATGEVWLHTYPRVLGYSFKPVSFWYCHADDGSLRAILVEVHNTFGERHGYLLERPVMGQPLEASKAFHVSPFCRVQGRYRFHFLRCQHLGQAHTVVRIDYFDDADQEALIRTSISGRLQPLDEATRRRALWRHPLLTLGVIARIHWQALRLWWRRVPFHPKTNPPAASVSRAGLGR